MDFSKYLIVSDLDGTLFNRKQLVPERSVKAIEYFKSHGGLFTVATGRDHRLINHRFPFIKELVNAPLITSNGASAFNVSNGETYVDLTLDRKLLKKLFNCCESLLDGIPIEIYARSKIYVIHPNELMYNRFSKLSDHVVYCDSVTIPDEDVIRVTMVDKNIERLKIAADCIIDKTRNEDIELVFSESFIFEILPYGATKGNAVNTLRSLLANDIIVICAGDWNNDISQLMAADIAVCPSNANQDVRNFCKYILCDCDDGIIADIVEHIENGLFDI